MTTQKEELFNERLKDIFIGEEIIGESGYANLMNIKSQYFDDVFEQLNADIDEESAKYDDPEAFRKEMYDKLYTFLKKYFSDSGSIYFTYTPLDEKVYEQVYDNNEDVSLFWKTHMLYYVKTDTLWEELTIEDKELDGFGYDVRFDVSEMKGKTANEKADLEFEIVNIQEDELVFEVSQSSYGMSHNKVDELRRELKRNDIVVDNDTLRNLFTTFQQQNEVDFFINKDAEGFLKSQFDMWVKQYLLDDDSVFDESRIAEIKSIRRIAYSIIDFVAQFEDELAKIWNKPRFVRNSNYVVTLNRLVEQDGGYEVLAELVSHSGWESQKSEWRDLGIVEEELQTEEILETAIENRELSPEVKYLPVDTSNFTEMKAKIEELFEDIDQGLDGRLIHSENYQALNTILPKFREDVDSIYIDPPFNLGKEGNFAYKVNFGDSSWITMLDNRLEIARGLMSEDSSIFVRCDHNGNRYVSLLLDDIFGRENQRNEFTLRRGNKKAGLMSQFADKGLKSLGVVYDSLYWYTKNPDTRFTDMHRKMDDPREPYWKTFKKIQDRPSMRYEILGETLEDGQWMWEKNRGWRAADNYKEFLEVSEDTGESLREYWERTDEELDFVRKNENGNIQYWVEPKEYELLNNLWTDIAGYVNSSRFKTENTEDLLKRVIQITSDPGETVLDFFLGSGTTVATAHKMGREWIGIEMGQQFYDVALPRMKSVVAYDSSGISEDDDIQERYGPKNAGGFFKYYELEQYEEALRNCVYEDSSPFTSSNEDVYDQYVFLNDEKQLDAVEVDDESESVNIDLSNLYDDVDVAETLANVRGKDIRSVGEDSVVFADSERVHFDELTADDIKSLIWW